MFVIKFTLSPEIPLTTVCWLCVPAGWLKGCAKWRRINIVSKV